MARFRVETILDTNTGLIYAECYYPEDAAEPIASTSPIYQSHEQAEKDVIDMFKKAFS